MRLDQFFKSVAPVIAMAAIEAASRCKGGDFQFNGRRGVPLADLDLTGDAPVEVVLFGPDNVIITHGKTFAIRTEGDGAAQLRFALSDGSLGILRGHPEDGVNSGPATVHVTIPSIEKLVLAGSGSIHADALADEAALSIAGSGTLEAGPLQSQKLQVSIAGSGSCTLAGTAEKLKLSIAGSGHGHFAGLQVNKAKINIAGSGSTIVACDGEVKASLMGSGNVTVRGSARCKVNSLGSGTLVCERAD